MKRIVSLLLAESVALLMVSCQRSGTAAMPVKAASAAVPQDTARVADQAAAVVATERSASDSAVTPRTDGSVKTERTPTAAASKIVPEVVKTAATEKAGQQASPAGVPTSARGLAAIDRAARTGKYLLVFFYKGDDDQTQKMRKVFDATAQKVAGRADAVAINTSDTLEKGIVAKFEVNRAPLPLALVLAPNGVITGGFPTQFDENKLTGAFVSPGLASSLKALQDGKLVLLCAQNASTKSNAAALQGVQAFKADTRFAQSTEIVSIDPTDVEELKFLTQLQIDPRTTEAVTALIAPPGSVVAKYIGATDKDTMVAALAAVKAGGGGG